jgi:hypothetical protein
MNDQGNKKEADNESKAAAMFKNIHVDKADDELVMHDDLVDGCGHPPTPGKHGAGDIVDQKTIPKGFKRCSMKLCSKRDCWQPGDQKRSTFDYQAFLFDHREHCAA